MKRTAVRTAQRERARLRAWWLRAQALTPGTAPATIAGCIRQIGWLRTAGGPGVYLSIRARMPGVSRDAIDRAAVDGTPLVEVPGPHARPPVLVPREDMALALCLHRPSYEKHLAAYLRYADIDATAIHSVASAVARALEQGPLSSAELRKALGRRDLGDLLLGALIDLSLRGIIRRFPADGRIDSPKYLYEWLHPDDRPRLDGEGDAAAIAIKVTERFLRWHGPSTIDELTRWAELTKKVARQALGALGAEPVEVADWADEAWMLPDDARRWRTFDDEVGEGVSLLPHRDPLVTARFVPAILTEQQDAHVLDPRQGPVPVSDVKGLHHHVIVCGGQMVGVWEYDPKSQAVVTRLWKADRALKRRVGDAADATGTFIREQLGDAKLSAVDPPAARAARLAFCRLC